MSKLYRRAGQNMQSGVGHMKFSANLGFLWTDRPLPDAIRAAKAAGFDAVECHWPFDEDAGLVKAALDETGLPMLGLNTRRGDVSVGENGLSALPDREAEARAAIEEAIGYAVAIGAGNVHVMAGFARGDAAQRMFVRNLRYACDLAAAHRITILIEPLNTYDSPGYFLTQTDHAVAVMKEVGRDNIRLMFDCFHVQLMEGDLTHRLTRLLPMIGHIQFASVPDRGTPDHGEVNYVHVFQVLEHMEYSGPLGAEYKPIGETDDSLDWLEPYKRLAPVV